MELSHIFLENVSIAGWKKKKKRHTDVLVFRNHTREVSSSAFTAQPQRLVRKLSGQVECKGRIGRCKH